MHTGIPRHTDRQTDIQTHSSSSQTGDRHDTDKDTDLSLRNLSLKVTDLEESSAMPYFEKSATD